MRKPSMMGTSKYEFNPEQFDVDIVKNRERLQTKRGNTEILLREILYSEPNRIDETWDMIISILREIKKGNETND